MVEKIGAFPLIFKTCVILINARILMPIIQRVVGAKKLMRIYIKWFTYYT